MKQGDPSYSIINGVGKGFCFYGTICKADAKKGWPYVEYDLFPVDAKRLKINRGLCCTITTGQDEPEYNPTHKKVDEAIAQLELSDTDTPGDDYDIVLPDLDDDDNLDGDNTATTIKKRKKKKTRKVLSIESFLIMSDNGVLQATTFDHNHGEGDG